MSDIKSLFDAYLNLQADPWRLDPVAGLALADAMEEAGYKWSALCRELVTSRIVVPVRNPRRETVLATAGRPLPMACGSSWFIELTASMVRPRGYRHPNGEVAEFFRFPHGGTVHVYCVRIPREQRELILRQAAEGCLGYLVSCLDRHQFGFMDELFNKTRIWMEPYAEAPAPPDYGNPPGWGDWAETAAADLAATEEG